MPRCHLRHTTKTLLAAVFAVAAPLGAQATPAQAQTRVVEQGTPVYVQGTGICTIGYNDPARHRSFTAAHCGTEGARVELINPATGARTGAAGTFYRSKAYDGRLGNDWGAIQWDGGVGVGGNGFSGDAWVHPRDIRLGETVCYYGYASRRTNCGPFSGSADNTFFAAAPLSHPGDSGGPMWVPGRGFVGVTSSMWSSNPLPLLRTANFVIGVVPDDGPAVPEARLVGVWAQNAFFPGLTGPVGEALRRVNDAVFRAVAGMGLGVPSALQYS